MRRRLLIAAVFLLAGAVVNVAVAWGCAAWSGGETWYESDYISSGRTRSIPQQIKSTHDRLVPPEWNNYVHIAYGATGFGFALYTLRSLQDRDRIETVTVFTGWPAPTLKGVYKYEHLHPNPPNISLTGVLRTNEGNWIPSKPLWPGFTANTLFYAAVLWLLICGPFAARRFVRRRRGLCPACAYDLRHGEHDACPECGRLPSVR